MRAELVRAEGYRLLALALGHPEIEALRSELRAAIDELAEIGALARLVDGELEAEHTRLFARTTPVSPYEGSYVKKDKGALLGQLAVLYELFGVRAGAEHEPPDHIGCELEFAGLLCAKRALSLRDGATEQREITEAARQVFMQEHLGCWAAAFAERLRRASDHAFFRALGELLPAWIERDLAEHGWRAEPLLRAQALPLREEAELVCPVRQDGSS